MNSCRKAILPALLAALTLSCAYGQTSGRANATGPPPPAGFQVYANADLHLAYTYPEELKPVDAAFAGVMARRMIYGEESDQAGSDTCARILLSVGEGSEGKGPWVRLGLVEVNGQCFPPKVLQKRKDTQMLLRNMVRQGTTVMGMMPVEQQPAGYLIQGHWASFDAAQGQPVTRGDFQTGEQQLAGVAAVQAGGNILAWVIETNDAGALNRLLATGVDFGAGKPEPLFGGGVR
jgi:hypothetical protein